MAAAASTNSLEDMLTCQICLQHYDNSSRLPKGFPCQHTVCLSCISDIKKTNPGQKFPCPVCRSTVNLPRRNASVLPNNLTVMQLLDRMASENKCSNHGDCDIIYICMTCGSPLCAKCMLPLSTNAHHDHEVETKEEAFKRALQSLNDMSGFDSDIEQGNLYLKDLYDIKSEHLERVEGKRQAMIREVNRKCDEVQEEVEKQYLEGKKNSVSMTQEKDAARLLLQQKDVHGVSKLLSLQQSIADINSARRVTKQMFQESGETLVEQKLSSITISNTKSSSSSSNAESEDSVTSWNADLFDDLLPMT